MTLNDAGPGERQTDRQKLVPSVAERIRARVFEEEPGERLGSLNELARSYGVGIVTIQQAARVLEHEGLLQVKRGPGGGYYGRRPDARSLERALSSYMRMHPDAFEEALDMTSLLFIELCAAASRCTIDALYEQLDCLSTSFVQCADQAELGRLETQLQDLLFRMVERPIFEMLTRVTLSFANTSGGARLHDDDVSVARWIAGRRRIIAAINARDEELARFEADRSNRRLVVGALKEQQSGD